MVDRPDSRNPTYLNVADRFDAEAVWASLAPEHQAAIGAAALDLVQSWHMQDQAQTGVAPADVLQWLGEHMDQRAIETLRLAFVDAVPRTALDTPGGQPRLTVSIGMVCEACGCHDLNACPGGCSWAAPNRCSECVAGSGDGQAEVAR